MMILYKKHAKCGLCTAIRPCLKVGISDLKMLLSVSVDFLYCLRKAGSWNVMKSYARHVVTLLSRGSGFDE
jgi:hypothetical protein